VDEPLVEAARAGEAGMGFAVVAPEDEAHDVIRALRPDVKAKVVGEVARGRGVAHEPLGLHWDSY